MFTCPPILPYFTPLPALDLAGAPTLGLPNWLLQVESDLEHALAGGTPIRQIVTARSCAIDSMIEALFYLYGLHQTDLTLFATGGYGRGELHPHSDIDLLLLSAVDIDEALNQKISPFIAKLWDIGIDPALAVRSVAECDAACRDDITIATSLLEARILAGNEALAALPVQLLNKNWSQHEFYDAKMAEAKARYLKHNATEYNLEPDLKNAPGGLRDIHTVGWISKRYFRVTSLFGLVQQEFITEKEFDELQDAEDFLWLVRHHLHKIAKRNENRILFDYQRLIAERFRSANLALTASSLTFTTLLTLVPFAAVALSAFTAFPMFAKAQDFLQRWLMESLIPEAIARQVLDYITQFAAKASRLGLVGFSMLVVTVLMLILTIDRTLNNIWRVRRLRPLGQRVLIYWAAITLGPLLLGLSLVFTSYVVSASRGMVQQVPGSVRLVFDSLQFFVLAAGMAALYHYVPNTLVRWRHAWMGGLFVAAAMELAKKGLALYLGQVPTYSAIYGTFATLPILLIWIYMAWLIVLLGAVITAELPTLQARATRHTEGEGARLQLAIEVLQQLHASAQAQPAASCFAILEVALGVDHFGFQGHASGHGKGCGGDEEGLFHGNSVSKVRHRHSWPSPAERAVWKILSLPPHISSPQ